MTNRTYAPLVIVIITTITVQGSFCSWGPDGSAETSVCDVRQGALWCSEAQENCEGDCLGRWCVTVTEEATEPPRIDVTVTSSIPQYTNQKTATTTRYWDCSGGACGCGYVPSGKSPDDVAHCYSNGLFAAPSNNAHGAKFYGTAAVSSLLGGGDWMGEACTKCWKVTGISNRPNSLSDGIVTNSTTATTIVLKGSNYCKSGACANGAHFDIAAPGFEQEGGSKCNDLEVDESAGFAACGGWSLNSTESSSQCDCSLFSNPILRAGCENFLSLQWDNVSVRYEDVECPAELTSLQCGLPWLRETSELNTCSSNMIAVDYDVIGDTSVLSDTLASSPSETPTTGGGGTMSESTLTSQSAPSQCSVHKIAAALGILGILL